MSTPYTNFFAPPLWSWTLLAPDGTYLAALSAATGRQLSFPIDGPATAQFTLPGLYRDPSSGAIVPHPQTAQVVEMATDLQVARNGRLVYRGRIGASTETHAGEVNTVNFTATDYRGMLAHRLIWPGSRLNFSAEDQGAIAWQLVADTQALPAGNLGIAQGSGFSTGQTRTRLYTAGVPLGQALDDLSNTENGFEYEMVPLAAGGVVFNLYSPRRFRDQTALTLAYGRGVTQVVVTVNSDAYANAVYYTGHQPETNPDALTVNTFPAGVGRWEGQYTDPNVTLQATVDEQANATLVTASQPDAAYTLTLSPAWWEPDNYWLGDLINIQVNDGRLDVDVNRRVVQIDITLDDNGTEAVVLTANPPPAPGPSGNFPAQPPGGVGKVGKITHRLRSHAQRISKLELVAATQGTAAATSVYANIVDYGAVASPTTDNAAALSAALATGKPVWVPEGRFGLSGVAPAASVPQVVIHGPGELVCLSATGSPLICAHQSFVELVGVMFSCSTAGPSPNGGPWVAIGTANRVNITGCQFTNVALRLTYAQALGATSFGPCQNVVVRGNVFSYGGNGGSRSIVLFCEAVSLTMIANNQITVTGPAGCLNLQSEGASGGSINVTGNQLLGYTGYYALVAASGWPMAVVGNMIWGDPNVGNIGYGQAGGTAGDILVSGNFSDGGEFVVGSGAGHYRVSGNYGMADATG